MKRKFITVLLITPLVLGSCGDSSESVQEEEVKTEEGSKNDYNESTETDNSSSIDFDEAMYEYEAFIDDYIVMLKKAVDLQKDP